MSEVECRCWAVYENATGYFRFNKEEMIGVMQLRDSEIAALTAELASTKAKLAEYLPKVEPLKLWYMRDNHTFRELTLSTEVAIAELREEYEAGNTYGMLCSHQVKGAVHTGALADWLQFEMKARKWLGSAISGKTKEGD